jgi:sirohydrochlorin ferrochelatase/(2Fe-2S) ferredoxin
MPSLPLWSGADLTPSHEASSLASRSPAVLVVGHGSRDPRANGEFEAFVASYGARRGAIVRHGYIELAKPSLAEALDLIAQEAKHVVVLPLFLFAAGHVKNDVPLALDAARARWPDVRFDVAPALGVHPSLAAVAFDRAASVGEADAKTIAVVVGRGSSDPDANGDFFKAARLMAEGRGWMGVELAFLGITRPLFPDALERAARARPDRIVVIPYLLFAGRLIEKLKEGIATFAERYPWIRTSLAPHMGHDDRIFAVLDERVTQAEDGTAPLPCDSCQYRRALPGFESQVGGLKALLYSVRHTLTHNQAMPHAHAHALLTKHVLVCTNADCADRGSVALIDSLRRAIKRAGKQRTIRVTRTSCMGRCGEGPTVVVYPDGVWYRGVREGDAAALVEEHLLGDRLVSRLVDGVMQ